MSDRINEATRCIRCGHPVWHGRKDSPPGCGWTYRMVMEASRA